MWLIEVAEAVPFRRLSGEACEYVGGASGEECRIRFSAGLDCMECVLARP